MREEKKVNQKVLIMIVAQMVLLILWMPGLEYPDACVHFPKIYNNLRGELYFWVLSLVRGIIETVAGAEVVFTPNDKFELFFWQPVWRHDFYNYISVMLYQSVNILLVIGSIWLFQVIVNQDRGLAYKEKIWLIRIDLLYFLLPPTAYLMVGITPDIILYLFQPFLLYLLYRNKYILSFLLSIILYIIADKSGAICGLFVGIMFVIKQFYRVKSTNKKVFLIFLFTMVGIPFLIAIRFYVNTVESDNFIIEVMQQSIGAHGRVLTKYINFFLESFCFWGSGSYITFPLLYVLYGWLLVKVFIKAITDKPNSVNGQFFLAVTGMIGGMIVIFPPYSSIRYYMFFLLIFLGAVFEYIIKDRYVQNNKNIMTISTLLFSHNIVLAGLIGIYTFVVM